MSSRVGMGSHSKVIAITAGMWLPNAECSEAATQVTQSTNEESPNE